MERRLFFWLFALAPLGLVSLFFSAVLFLPKNKIPPDANDLVSVSLFANPVINPDNELLILQDDHPIHLKISLSDELEVAGFQCLNSNITWHATNGKIEPITEWSARWSPPQLSSTVRIVTNITRIYRQSGLAGILGKTFSLFKQASVTVISPTSSRFLKNGTIDGFALGEYLSPYAEEEIKKFPNVAPWYKLFPQKFSPPEYFYKVTAENKDLKISQHYTLGDFALDYPWFSLGFPQYIALDYNLIKKLEELQVILKNNGYNLQKFKFIYGFRPPAFNITSLLVDREESLKAPFSIHQYGRAADIIIDNNDDNIMDDLNHDGKNDINDVKLILLFVDQLDNEYKQQNSPLVGGAGVYAYHDFKGRVQSPYLHIDVRGFVRPDGSLIRWSIP